ncbi:MAG: ArsR family transcriptional regulator [archaeon]
MEEIKGTRKQILLLLDKEGKMKVPDVAKKIGCSRANIYEQAKKLQNMGIISYKSYNITQKSSEMKLIKNNINIENERDFNLKQSLLAFSFLIPGILVSLLTYSLISILQMALFVIPFLGFIFFTLSSGKKRVFKAL